MPTYIDSSALLRLCLGEGDLSHVERAFREGPASSVLAAVEVPCAIAARFHRGLLTRDQRDVLFAAVTQTLAPLVQIGLNQNVREEAVGVADRFLVRALDAIHVATAVVMSRQQLRQGHVVRFCTADLRQADAARALLGEDRVDVVPPLWPPSEEEHPTTH